MSRNLGKPYTRLYTERGRATGDSERMRRRLGAFLTEHMLYDEVKIHIKLQTGNDARSGLEHYFQSCALHDLLDSITHTYNAMILSSSSRADEYGDHWLLFVVSVFSEENVSYRIDHEGTVHPAVDEEFNSARRATLAALDQPRYRAALQHFEDAIASLRHPVDTRGAVRGVFDALETVAKLMISKIPRLNAKAVQEHIKPIALKSLNGAEHHATSHLLDGFCDWINACHYYRHAQATEEPAPPSLELAIWIISSGAAHLRWLVGIDQANLK